MAKPAKKPMKTRGVAPGGDSGPAKTATAVEARKAPRRAEAAKPLKSAKPVHATKPAKPPKATKRVEKHLLAPFEPNPEGSSAEVLDRLWRVIDQRRTSGDAATSHSARLLARGTPKVAQKLGEEAVELVIEAITGDRAAIIAESADVLYHMLVLWVDAAVNPDEVWGELRRREGISGIAEKAARPKALIRLARTTKLP